MSTTTSPHFLAPYSLDAFFERHWEKDVLVIRRDRPDYFRDVITLEQLDALVTSTAIPATVFNLAEGDRPLPPATYSAGGAVDHHRALQLHERGATIILRSLDQFSPTLCRLRAAAEELFGCEAQINVYLTPPGKKSTPPHWDTHDLFILQVHGEKRWKLFRGERTLPLAEERFAVGSDVVREQYDEIVLRAGDTMYLPRGVIHEPVADSYSAHVSLGLHHARWVDVLTEALRIAAEREGSPLRLALRRLSDATVPAATALTDAVLADVLRPDVLGAAVARLEQAFTRRRAIDQTGRLLEVARPAALDASTRFRRRPGVELRREVDGDGVRLRFHEESVAVQPPMRPAIEHIAEHTSFTAAELPGDLSLDERLALGLALLELGALQVDAPASHA